VTDSIGVISGLSVSQQAACVEAVETAAASSQRVTVERLLSEPSVEEAFVLQTCNRVEGYVVTDDPASGQAALADLRRGVADESVRTFDHEASLRHLMRVAAGLESLILGEDQILGQVGDAYEDARAVGGIGPILDEAVTKAIRVGERARTETAINDGVVSLGSAAVRLARREADFSDATALVVGAGEMGTLAAKALAGTDGITRLLVANRTVPHAEHVVEAVSGVDAAAIGLEALTATVAKADVVVTATGSPGPIIDVDALADAGETIVVDIAQPRDVPPAADSLANVATYDLDALEDVTAETRERRQEAALAVESIIDEEFDRLLDQYKRKRADEVIAAMYEGAEHVKNRELDTALSQLDAHGDLNDDQRAVVESMADALVSQLLAPPTKSLRDAAGDDDWTTINTALRLFNPEFDADEALPPFVTEASEDATADD
jgi:glutamyl-tRNA reductase